MRRLVLLVVFCWMVCQSPVWGEDWPHWRGPNRDGRVSSDSGYKAGQWLSDKPDWQAKVGAGSSSPLVIDGRLYTMGWRDGEEHLVCLDATTGNGIWRASYAAPRYGRHATGDQALYSGPSSTPEYDADTGFLYSLGSDGDLHCWDTRRQGQRVWHVNLYAKYGAEQRPKVGRSGRRDYGYTSSPLVYRDWLIVEVGAAAGNLVAFDKGDGREVWTSQASSPAGHNGGPVPITVEGVACVAVHNFDGLLVVRLDSGKEGETIATYPWKTSFANNIATPGVSGNNVVITSAYNHYKIARLQISLNGARKVWEQPYASKVCSPVIHDGHVYWAWRELICLDFATGQLRWKGGRFGEPGSCIVTGDDRLIVWAKRGDLILAETARRSPSAYRQLAARTGVFRRDAWPHVVLAGGRVYCKDRDGNLACFAAPGNTGM